MLWAYSALPADRTQGHQTVEPADRRERAREDRGPGRVQRVRRQRRPVELERGHAGVHGARGAGPGGDVVQRPRAGRVGAGLHAVRVRVRPAAVHRGHRAGRARADPRAAGAVAGAAGRVAAAGASVAPHAGQGPGHADHAAGHQAARLGDAVRRRAAARRAGQLLSAGRGQRRGDDERRQVRAQAQHADTDQSHAQKPFVSREYTYIIII